MYLSLSSCAFQERGHSQREKALSWERKQFLYPLARVYLKRPHTQRHLECLSLSHSLSLRKSSSFSSSFREREKETYFFRLLVARSLFPVHFLPFQKSCITRALSFALSLAHTRTQRAASRDDATMIYTTALLFAHSSELFVRTKKERERKEHLW